jgi:PEP-CTERM motif-containing protein
MKTTALALIFAAALCADTIKTTATLTAVNGNTLDGVFAGPYTLDVGGAELMAWCADPFLTTALGVPYAATVTTGDVIPGISQEMVDEIYSVVALAEESGNPDNPDYQGAIWHVEDPAQYPDSAAIESILSKASESTLYPGQFEWISGTAEQPFAAAVPPTQTPEPATWGMVLIGLTMLAGGWRWTHR